jgi:hypothetical protein
MIAMQYSFALPADYDMAIIDRRIRDRGPLLDGSPRLRFKAYLSARKRELASSENLYAPFYLWDEPEGLNEFVTGPGFAAVSADFGWPSVRTWVVWRAELGPELGAARFASRAITPIAPHADLAALRADASAETAAAVRAGSLAAIVGFDPTGWTKVRFELLKAAPSQARDGAQLYAVGHVSLPRAAS